MLAVFGDPAGGNQTDVTYFYSPMSEEKVGDDGVPTAEPIMRAAIYQS